MIREMSCSSAPSDSRNPPKLEGRSSLARPFVLGFKLNGILKLRLW